MLVQSLHYNLLSTIQLACASYDSLFSEFHVTVFRRDTLKVVFVGHVEGNLYVVDFSKEITHLKTCLMAKADVGWLWHRRLADEGVTPRLLPTGLHGVPEDRRPMKTPPGPALAR